MARRRHIEALLKAQQSLQAGTLQLTSYGAGELLAEDLKQAQNALSEIIGEFSSDELTRITDLRHGPSSLAGSVRVATVVMAYVETGEPVTLRASGSIIGPDGSAYEVVISESASIAPNP